MENSKNKFYKKWWFWIIIFLLLVGIGNFNSNNTITTSNFENITISNEPSLSLKHGELLNFLEDTSSDTNKFYCVIKAKINESATNQMTISQNFFNIEDFILNQNGNKYDEIQYWAVMDINLEEIKIISFTVDKNIINKIYNKEIPINQLQNYLSDYWVSSILEN